MSKAKCKNCKTIIESKSRHHFVVCKCFQESTDKENNFRNKLLDYLEEYTNKFEDKDVATFIHIACCAFNKTVSRGVFLDGGNDYSRCGGNLGDFEWLEK